jgi:hypothetical protein
MQNAELLTAFVIVSSVAIVIQAGILIAMYLAMRQTSARLESLATEVKTKVVPTAETAQAIMAELRPKIAVVVDNVSQTSTMMRAQLERLDATLNDLVDRARLQVIRADEMLSRGLDRVETTSEVLQQAVTSPVRKLSGVVAGVTAGMEFLLGNKRRREGAGLPQDEMFI